MQIQLNPGDSIDARESLAQRAEEIVTQAVGRFADQITRVEVHVSDDNSVKGAASDKRCTMEARVRRHRPVAVTHHASTVREAMGGAAEKLQRSLEHTLGKLDARR